MQPPILQMKKYWNSQGQCINQTALVNCSKSKLAPHPSTHWSSGCLHDSQSFLSWRVWQPNSPCRSRRGSDWGKWSQNRILWAERLRPWCLPVTLFSSLISADCFKKNQLLQNSKNKYKCPFFPPHRFHTSEIITYFLLHWTDADSISKVINIRWGIW